MVARDLKSLGLYTARALSFAGVDTRSSKHRLTLEQIAVYDAYADAWAIIHDNLREALEATRIVDADIRDHRLAAIAVTTVPSLGLVAKVMIQLDIERAFGQGLLQRIEQPALIEDGCGIAASQKLIE